MADPGDPLLGYGRDCSRTPEPWHCRQVHAGRVWIYDRDDGMDYGNVCVWIRDIPDSMRMGGRPFWPALNAYRSTFLVGAMHDDDQRSSFAGSAFDVEVGLDFWLDSPTYRGG